MTQYICYKDKEFDETGYGIISISQAMNNSLSDVDIEYFNVQKDQTIYERRHSKYGWVRLTFNNQEPRELPARVVTSGPNIQWDRLSVAEAFCQNDLHIIDKNQELLNPVRYLLESEVKDRMLKKYDKIQRGMQLA